MRWWDSSTLTFAIFIPSNFVVYGDPQISALRLLGKHGPIFMLFAGNDQWAPSAHMKDISKLQEANVLPSNISMTYLPELRHDYVSHDGMPSKVVEWCFQSIVTTCYHQGARCGLDDSAMRSRL
jgi:hypothetical protein